MTTMTTMKKYGAAALLALALLTGCTEGKHEQAAPTDEVEPLQVTAWSDKTEVYFEADPPEAGKKGGILIHLTRLTDFKPVTEGALTVTLRPATGSPLTVTLPKPERPGIYRAELTPAVAGEAVLELAPEGKGFADRIVIHGITVAAKGEKPKNGHGDHGHDSDGKDPAGKAAKHGEKEGAHGDHGDHDEQGEHGDHDDHAHGTAGEAEVVFGSGGAISFLKEQQWVVDFMVGRPERRALAAGFSAAGELVPQSNAEATVSAPLAGVLSVSRTLPFVGQRVAKGQVVAVIEPPTRPDGGIGQLSSAYGEAKSRLNLAQLEYDRAKRLHEAKIAPKKRVEEAEAALESARAVLAPLEKSVKSVSGANGGRIEVRAPISGTVVEVAAGNGRGVEAGQPIVRIANTGTLWLKTSIPAMEAGKLPAKPDAAFTVAGMTEEFAAPTLVSVGDMLDPQTRTLPVIFAVPNPGGRLKAGMFATVTVRTGSVAEALTLPKEALFDDEGRWFVFIHTTGERFDRREVKVGIQDRGIVQITDGLKEHERVVVRGSYYVKQAAAMAKGGDAHAGHAH